MRSDISIRGIQSKRAVGMNPSEKPLPNDKDFNKGLEPGAIHAEEDIEEGDEEEESKPDLPPAMPPGA
jgi:hypothetical protein